MAYHFYKLAGDSLNALNKLIEFDSIRNEDANADFNEKIKRLLPPSASRAADPEKAQKKEELKAHFTAAQVRCYQSLLGFTSPAVDICDYGHGIVRAYHVMPRIAMNPGTSKGAFGFINILKEAGAVGETPQIEAGRTAFYASPEDYTGAHFIPPGAIPVTDAELAAYAPMEDLFEYYETYREGIPVPAGVDLAAHDIARSTYSHLIDNFNHFFLLGGDTLARMLEWREQSWPWTDAYQKFREKFYDDVRAEMPALARHLTVWIEEAGTEDSKRLFGSHSKRCLLLTLPSKVPADNWDALEKHFDILKVEKHPRRAGHEHFYVTPSPDTELGIQIAKDLARVPVRLPQPPAFLQVSTEHPVYQTDVTGFPDYYRIERYEDAAVKLLVINLPQIKSVNMPADFTPVSLDDYAALSGDAAKTATHVFRIGGETYDALAAYDTAHRRQRAEEAAFWQLLDDQLVKPRPEDGIEEPLMGHYKDPAQHKSLMFRISERLYRANMSVFHDCFDAPRTDPIQEDQRHHVYFDTINTDTPTGKTLSDALYAVSPCVHFPPALNSLFGFDRNGGYGFMDVKPMSGLDQYAILWSLPPFVTEVHTPPDCMPLTRREYATIILDNADISNGSVPPPRPADLTHLPMPGGQKSYTHIKNLKDGKDKDGLPLHKKTVFDWFNVPRR
jgi:hypothetical protein